MGASISVAAAAIRLGVSESTIRNMLSDGRLRGRRGSQPQRPRWSIQPDADGDFVDKRGHKLESVAPSLDDVSARIDRLQAAVDVLRDQAGSGTSAAQLENFRDVAITLQAASERRQRVIALQSEALRLQAEANIRQAEAIEELNQLVSDQADIISGQIVGDVHSDIIR